MMVARRTVCRAKSAFTLLELTLATAMFVVLLGALYGVFDGASKLQKRSRETFGEGLSVVRALRVLRQDLSAIGSASGVLDGPVLGEKNEEPEGRRDSLQVHAASGVLTDAEPWAELQRVTYSLRELEEGKIEEGFALVRATTRNLLASLEEEPKEEVLLSGVATMEFSYYDGETWVETWDSTVQESVTPLAIQLRVEFVAPEPEQAERAPVEMVVPLVVRPVGSGGGRG